MLHASPTDDRATRSTEVGSASRPRHLPGGEPPLTRRALREARAAGVPESELVAAARRYAMGAAVSQSEAPRVSPQDPAADGAAHPAPPAAPEPVAGPVPAADGAAHPVPPAAPEPVAGPGRAADGAAHPAPPAAPEPVAGPGRAADGAAHPVPPEVAAGPGPAAGSGQTTQPASPAQAHRPLGAQLPATPPLTRRAIREARTAHRPAARRRPPAVRSIARVADAAPPIRHLACDPKPPPEVLDNVGVAAGRAVRPVTAVAAAAVAATMIQMGLPASPTPPEAKVDPEVNALTPLRDTVEEVAQRGVREQASRSSLVRTVALAQDANLDVARRSNSTITLAWNNPRLTEGDQVVVRRTQGAKPAETIKDGDDVPLDGPQVSELLDQGLVPETEYTYAVFVKRENAKPQLVATETTTTRLNPTELRGGDSLWPGEKLVSENGKYALNFGEDGLVHLTNKDGMTLWSPSSTPAETLEQDSSGALVLHDGVQAVWSTVAAGAEGVTRVTNSGDVRVLDGEDVVWQRGPVGEIGPFVDDYPFSRGSPLGYSPNNCTDFVAWRLNRNAGITSAPWKFAHRTMTPAGGNAVQWIRYYPNDTDDTPALGAVAWWGSNTGGGRGHVAIVSAVREDGSIVIEEYNFYNRGNYGTRILRPGTADWPTKFIHINDL